ncbi:MAG: alpha-L-fucosidase [Verrucomicrobia bacterium]|nr:alpha-L-fucosidase [Verrucomicrobiota bacterium]
MKPPILVRPLLALLLGATALLSRAPAAEATAVPPVPSDETPEQHNARMKWWREARFGLFIHWGIYSVPAGTWQGKPIPGIGEWIMNRGKIPVADYAKFAEQFNPVKFDADAWVRLAKEAGMKYIVITSKHHDGFAMFKSAASPYNIHDATPFKRDPLKELAAACQKHGVKLGFYYSQAQDWHHRGGAASGGQWDKPAQEGDMDAYLRDIAVPQVKEILTNYGPVAVLWWDTPTNMNRARADLLAPLIKLQPGLITNNRLGGGYQGDTETPENKVPATGYPRDWEACMTMNDTWGFKSDDHNWKSGEKIIRTLVDIASKGGNYLLNVGPTSEGEIPAPSVERLRQVGAWMKLNSESVYATTASPFKRLDWGRATQKPGKLYLNVFNWPADGNLVVPMRGTAKKAYLLSAPKVALKFTATPAGLRVQVPAAAPDAISSVVVLEGVGTVDPLPPPPIAQATDGTLALGCDEAELVGKGLRVEGNTQLNLAGWNSTAVYPQWEVRIDRPGTYEVTALWAVSKAQAGGEFALTVGDQALSGTIAATAESAFKPAVLGTVTVTKTGPTQITLKAVKLATTDFARFRALTLKPKAATPVQPK